MYYLSYKTQKPEHVELLLQEARKANPFNYPAWIRYLNIKGKNVSDQQKLIYLKEFAQAMPNEHNLIWHVAKNVLKIREKKINPYELYACILSPNCTSQAEELFTRLVWNKLVTDCPEIGDIVKYKEGFTGKHLSVWVNKSKYVKWTPKMKKQSVKMLQNAIQSLENQATTRMHYVDAYKSLLKIWNDKKLIKEFEDFIGK